MRTKAKDILRDYSCPQELSDPRRLAHCLDWAAREIPGEYLPYNILLRVIRGYAHTPKLGSRDVGQLRTKMTRANAHLRTEHGREVIVRPGLGVRASVDAADATREIVPKKTRRLLAAKESLKLSVQAIQVSQLPQTAEGLALKKWLTKDVGDVLKALDSPNFDQKCLPPKPGEGK